MVRVQSEHVSQNQTVELKKSSARGNGQNNPHKINKQLLTTPLWWTLQMPTEIFIFDANKQWSHWSDLNTLIPPTAILLCILLRFTSFAVWLSVIHIHWSVWGLSLMIWRVSAKASLDDAIFMTCGIYSNNPTTQLSFVFWPQFWIESVLALHECK